MMYQNAPELMVEIVSFLSKIDNLTYNSVVCELDFEKIIYKLIQKQFGRNHVVLRQVPLDCQPKHSKRRIDILVDGVFLELKVIGQKIEYDNISNQMAFYKQFSNNIILLVYERTHKFDFNKLQPDIFNSIILKIIPMQPKKNLTIQEELESIFRIYDIDHIILMKDKLRSLKARKRYVEINKIETYFDYMAELDNKINYITQKIKNDNLERQNGKQAIDDRRRS